MCWRGSARQRSHHRTRRQTQLARARSSNGNPRDVITRSAANVGIALLHHQCKVKNVGDGLIGTIVLADHLLGQGRLRISWLGYGMPRAMIARMLSSVA